ncbi:MAG: S9 family peptidase [Gemmataceae bacterium]
MTRTLLCLPVLACAVAGARADDPKEPTPPVAKKAPAPRKIHDDEVVDSYRWLQDKRSAEVLSYLEAENAYTEAKTAHLKGFAEKLYKEALARIQQTDQAVPVLDNGYWYYTRTVEGKQYPIHCRKKGTLDAAEEVMLDANELAKGHKFFSLGATAVSPDAEKVAYASDVTGFREYYLSVKDLKTGKLLEDRKVKVNSFAWAGDNATIFYVTEDAAKRPYRMMRHAVGGGKDEPVYEEKDELYRLFVRRSRDRKYLFAVSSSSNTRETRYLDAKAPAGEWKVVLPRKDEHEYDVEHRDGLFWMRTNKDGKTYKLVTAPVEAPEKWTDVVPMRENVSLEGLTLFRDYAVLSEREDGLPHLAIRDLATGGTRRVKMPEPVYSAFVAENPDFNGTTLRYRYTSLVTPGSTFEHDLKTGEQKLLKQDKVLGGYDASQYASERIWATAPDGVKVPVSLVYKKTTPRDGSAPLWLHGYGSYGASSPVGFSSSNLLLLDRGLIVATAHIRGGGDLGKRWHDAGRMMNKRNTFTDFIACADHLVKEKYTSRDRLAIEGASAGGLLIGAVVNFRPDLCKVAVLGVPFVDVINTMLDPSLPLTIQEYLEWGNPNKRSEYEYMKSYCPYTNLKATDYPAMYVFTSLNDSQVMYWEPAKYVAKLRTLKQNRTPLLLKTNMAAGHGGASGRYDAMKERAARTAFVLGQLGVSK